LAHPLDRIHNGGLSREDAGIPRRIIFRDRSGQHVTSEIAVLIGSLGRLGNLVRICRSVLSGKGWE
jgi:hypothetical protein